MLVQASLSDAFRQGGRHGPLTRQRTVRQKAPLRRSSRALPPAKSPSILAHWLLAQVAHPGACGTTADAAAARPSDDGAWPGLRRASTLCGKWADRGRGLHGASRSWTRPYAGLGLATSYALVEQNGGVIRVQSQLGQGTTMELYFPEQVVLSAAVASTLRSRPAPAGLGVMVAEDDEKVRSSLVRALGIAGFKVYESADAASAIALLERVGREVDVLCTDGIMPGGGTRELIDRYLARRPEGKVILCSGYVKEELLRRQIDAGALAYLAKPFLPTELIERIHALTQPGSGGATPVQSTVRASKAPPAERAEAARQTGTPRATEEN